MRVSMMRLFDSLSRAGIHFTLFVVFWLCISNIYTNNVTSRT